MTVRRAGEGRYAQVEREQRWLLHALPDGLEQPVPIVDLYIRGTRLRLRRMETAQEVVYKLGQKVRPEATDPETVMLTTMYLSEPEYARVAALEADKIVKTRWRWTAEDPGLVVDRFEGDLAGLILAEIELGRQERRRGPPTGVVGEVTDDDRFSGGTLATTTRAALLSLLAEKGVTPPGADGRS